MSNKDVVIDYTNWRGERAMRRIRPISWHFEVNKYHEGRQWLLQATDLEKRELRVFALTNIHSWKPA